MIIMIKMMIMVTVMMMVTVIMMVILIVIVIVMDDTRIEIIQIIESKINIRQI